MSAKTNLLIDFSIFAAFLVAFEAHLTGIVLHEWLSLALFAVTLVHLLLHWQWLVSVTTRFFQKLVHETRLNYVVDAALLVSFVTLMLSGILISESILPTLGIRVEVSRVWRMLHATSANVSLAMVALHFALHWNWVVRHLKRLVWNPLKGFFQPHAARPAAVPVRSDEER